MIGSRHQNFDETRTRTAEALRKLLHIAFGAAAVVLRWLSTAEAAAFAAAALLFSWLVLPHVGGRFLARNVRGFDRGTILYPASVFLLVVALPQHPFIAAAVWAILGFGDGAATVVGRAIHSRALPWNQDKSIAGMAAFIEVGIPGAYAIALLVRPPLTYIPLFWIVTMTVVACAIVETLPLNIDDNVSVPLTGALTMFALVSVNHLPDLTFGNSEMVWLVANVAFAGMAIAGRTVTLSGAVAGAVLGSLLILFAGPELYIVLAAFFALASMATKLGFKTKAQLGIAQVRSGRRSAIHALANVGVATSFAFLIATSTLNWNLLWLGAVAALTTAAADTCSTEIGQWLGKRAFLPLTFQRVEPGTPGGISIEGTVAGMVAALVVGSVGVAGWLWKRIELGGGEAASWNGMFSPDLMSSAIGPFCLVWIAAVAGSYMESIVGSWNRTRSTPIPNSALNFMNTLAGAALFVAMAHFAQRAQLL